MVFTKDTNKTKDMKKIEDMEIRNNHKNQKTVKTASAIFSESLKSLKSLMPFFANNEKKGSRVKAHIAAMVAMLLIIGVGDVWGGNVVYTFNTDAGISALGITKPSTGAGTDLGTSFSQTISPITMTTPTNGKTATRVWNSSGTLDLRIYKDGTFCFTAASGYNITRIVLTGSTVGGFTKNVGSFSAGTWTGTASSVTLTATETEKINTITIYYCDKSVTISKGTETNCTFTLSKSGTQASCDGVSTTVTVSPTTGYGTPVVTQSGASAAPGITGTGTTRTVTYAANTTGTSTINVSCSANNYTITLNNESATTAGTGNITATYNASTNLTSAIIKPTKTGWVFGGYYTSKNGGGTQIIDANGNVIASAGGGSTYTDASRNWKYAGNITLYAKWTCTVTWSVNGSTSVYPTQTITYNSAGCKVSSVPTPNAGDYCGDKFMGWTRTDIGAIGLDKEEDASDITALGMFSNVAGSPELKTIGNITFYAVFANYAE